MRTNVELITPELAKEYLSRNFNNRPLRRDIVTFYSKQMKENLWKLTGQGISFDTSNKLIDGQHRLAAVIASNTCVNMLVIYGVESTNFNVYDTGKNRSNCDLFSIEKIPYASTLSSGINGYINLTKKLNTTTYGGFQSKKVNITGVDLLNEYHLNKSTWEIIAKRTDTLYNKLPLFSKSVLCAIYGFLVISNGKDIDLIYKYLKQLYSIDTDEFKCTTIFRDFILKNKINAMKFRPNDLITLFLHNYNAYCKGLMRFNINSFDLTTRPEVI